MKYLRMALLAVVVMLGAPGLLGAQNNVVVVQAGDGWQAPSGAHVARPNGQRPNNRSLWRSPSWSPASHPQHRDQRALQYQNAPTYPWANSLVLRSVRFGEKGGLPCFLEMDWWTRAVAPAGGGVDGFRSTTTFDVCPGGATRSTRLQAKEVKFVSTGFHHAAAGIRICTRGSNGRMKGIKLFGSRLRTTGAERVNGMTAEEERSRCNSWQQPKRCPANQVITRLRISWTIDDGIKGIAPFCARARISPASAS